MACGIMAIHWIGPGSAALARGARAGWARVRALVRGRAARPARRAGACFVCVVAALGGVGLLGGPAGDDNPASGRFRPGGVSLHRVGYLLEHGARGVDGCARVRVPEHAQRRRGELDRLLDVLARSATGRDALRQAEWQGVHICEDAETDLLAYYFAGMRVIGLSTDLSEAGRIVFLAHELAHVPQHPVYSDNRHFPADDLVLLRRVREAAAEAIATRIAWELREAGNDAAWEEKLATSYADVARSFAAAMAAEPASEPSLAATRAAFDRWFEARWRLNVYDRMTVDHLERISGDAIGLVAPGRFLTHDFLEGIAWVPGGNFLAGSGERLLTDPYYGGNLSPRIAGDLERVLRRGLASALPADAAAVHGPDS
jgi:hypothetical protein